MKHCVGAAMEEDKITAAEVVNQCFEDHNPQLYPAFALLCKGSAMVTVKNTDVNNGLAAWPTSTDAVLVTAEVYRVDPADD